MIESIAQALLEKVSLVLASFLDVWTYKEKIYDCAGCAGLGFRPLWRIVAVKDLTGITMKSTRLIIRTARCNVSTKASSSLV